MINWSGFDPFTPIDRNTLSVPWVYPSFYSGLIVGILLGQLSMYKKQYAISL